MAKKCKLADKEQLIQVLTKMNITSGDDAPVYPVVPHTCALCASRGLDCLCVERFLPENTVSFGIDDKSDTVAFIELEAKTSQDTHALLEAVGYVRRLHTLVREETTAAATARTEEASASVGVPDAPPLGPFAFRQTMSNSEILVDDMLDEEFA